MSIGARRLQSAAASVASPTIPYTSTSMWGTSKAVVMGSPAVTTRPTTGAIDPTTGAPYVTYESLYQPGDTVTQALDRLTSPAVVTFPEGEFTFSDFAATHQGVDTGGGINLNKNYVRGIWGSGRGTPWGTSGTRFRMVPNTSTKANSSAWTPLQSEGGLNSVYLMRAVGMTGGLVLKNFAMYGTGQGEGSTRWPEGHNYQGIYVFNTAGPVLIEDLFVSGWKSDNGAPPGEEFGISVYTSGGIQPVTIRRCETDGRRSDGQAYGGPGITLGKNYGGLIEDCYCHDHHITSGLVLYHTANATVRRTVMCNPATRDVSGWTFNGECNTGSTFEDCHFGTTVSNGNGRHMTFSNGSHVLTWGSTSISTANGSLLVKGCTWDNIGYGGRLAIESWSSGIDGGTADTMTTPPQVVNASGTGLSYRWVHNTHQDIQSPNL